MSRRPNAARWARLLAVVSSLTFTACGGARLVLPGPGGTPATDAGEALAQATAGCGSIHTFTAELAVSGRVAGRRLRARILAGTATPSSMFLDAPAPFGASVFQLAATGDEATLILPRDRRMLEHAHPDAVLEALTGVPLSPAAMHLALTGCVASPDVTAARAVGDDWRVIPGEQEVYLHRATTGAAWQLVAVVHRGAGSPGWRTEHRDFVNGRPQTLQLVSLEPGRFDLRVSLSQVETNAPLEASTFQLKVPAGFTPVTIEELRASGPLAEKDR